MSSNNFIIGYIIDAYAFKESRVIIIIRTINNNKSIIYINNFKPYLLIKYTNANIIKLSECVFINKLSNIEIDNELYHINSCEQEMMIRIYCLNKQTLNILNDFFNKNNIEVYNYDRSLEYQFFNYNNIDPSIVVKVYYTSFTKHNDLFVYEINSTDIVNVSHEEHEQIFNKIPLQIMIYDIEVQLSSGSFPNPNNLSDNIIAISCINYSTVDPLNQQTSIYYINNNTIIDSETMKLHNITNQYKCIDERSLVIQFSKKLVECDIIVDFNGAMFDLPYILKRLLIYNTKITYLFPIVIFTTGSFLSFYGVIHLDVLKIFKNRDADKNKENNLNFLCMKYLRQNIIKIHNSNQVECSHFDAHIGITCELVYDLMEDIIRQDFNSKIINIETTSEGSVIYTLDKSLPILNKNSILTFVKDDFKITKIDPNDNINFKNMLLYCINDTRLTNYLLCKQNYILLYIQKSQIRSAMIRDSITRGNSYLNQYMITREMIKHKWAIKLKQLNDKTYIDEKYTGATVINPKSGIFPNVSVLDFNSLYPSIIISYNICMTTLVTHDLKLKYNIPNYKLHDMIVENEPIYFFKDEFKKGITPYFCDMFIKMRTNVKNKLNDNNLSKHDKMLLNLKQMNLKVSNNSIYGSMGDANSVHFNKYVAASIPCMGRYHLEMLKKFFEQKTHIIIGGDTDSIFVKVNCDQTVFKLQLDEYNTILKAPMKIEQEKIYEKLFLNSKKKKRFGIINNKIEIKGYMSVKRDTPIILKEIENDVFNIILYNDKFEELLLNYVSNINLKSLHFDKFAITKTLKCKDEYVNENVPHLCLALKLIQLKYLSGFESGDKIKYAYIENNKAKYVKDKIATYELIVNNRLQLDYDKYKMDIYNMIKYIIEDVVNKQYLINLLNKIQ